MLEFRFCTALLVQLLLLWSAAAAAVVDGDVVCLLLLLLLQGKVEKDSEVLMIIKTQASLLDALTAKVGHLQWV
jgi:uncharacterized protein involved in tolerance to divalent cations